MKTLILYAALITTNPSSFFLHSQQNPKFTHVDKDDFISSLLEDLSYDKLSAAKYKSTSMAAKGASVKVVTFLNGKNTFAFNKSAYNTFIKSFTILQPEKLTHQLFYIGESKEKTLKRLGVSKSFDILEVTDLEGGAIVKFYFKDEKLQKVVYGSVID